MLVLAVGVGCGDKPPATDLAYAVDWGAEEVVLGKAFTVRAERTWNRRYEPAPWRDDAFAPLRLRLRETIVREDDGRVSETRIFDAYAFAPGVLAVPPQVLRVRPKAGGPVREAEVAGREYRVVTELDPDEPGAPELPAAAEEKQSSVAWIWGATLLLVLLAAGIAVRRRRRRGSAPVPTPLPDPPPAPHIEALARLAALRAESAVHAPVAEIVRTYVAARFGVDADVRTTQELVRAVTAPGLEPVLRDCDFVKFAGHEPDAAECARVVEAAEALVRSTAS